MGCTVRSPVAPRADFPAVRDGAGASLQLALAAAPPGHQEASLRALGQDMLAPSTRPSVGSPGRGFSTLQENVSN